MVARIRSLGLYGIGGYEVSVEIFLSSGLPQFDLVGLPDTAVREARERVRAAVKQNGLEFPVSRVTVNLAPADKKKAGTVYDLPILLGILQASEQLRGIESDMAFFGELSLTGDEFAQLTAVQSQAIKALQEKTELLEEQLRLERLRNKGGGMTS